ncbi:MAG: PmoA family protein [Chthoniobacteraceae bacterium]
MNTIVHRCRLFLSASALMLGLAVSAHAAGAGFTADKSPTGVVIKHNGQPFAEYVITEANKPYLFPVYGPTGKSMTRAFPMQKVEGEQTDHYHHRGICFGHQDINGFDSWMERGSVTQVDRSGIDLVPDDKLTDKQKASLAKMGTTRHVAFKEITADAQQAVIVEENEYVGSDGKKSVTEIRKLTFRVEGDTRLIDWDQEFIARDGEVTFGDRKDAGLSIRVPSSMAVDTKKGGHIVTSTGITDKDAWGKRAPWVDYSGPVDDETLGVAMLNHPTSFRHPTSWHVRTYGLFTANCFGSLDKNDPNGPVTLKQGEKLVLRHRFVFHKGDENAASIAAAYERYAKEK